MSNLIYEKGFYNEYQKYRYLKTVPEKSISQTERIFNRVRVIEEKYDCDLYNFNLDQIESLLHYLEPTTINSSRVNFYNVSSYIRWGIEQDLRDNNLNPLELLSDATYLRKFIDDSKKALYTKDEIDEMVDGCLNAQDSVVVQLIFEGVFGSIGYDELLNLNKNSLQGNNGLLLKDGGEERFLKVSDKCIRLIQKALNEKTYFKKNGETKETIKSSAEAELIETNYVLRNVLTNKKSEVYDKADKHLVLRRVSAVREYNKDKVKVLTPYIIRKSGMLWMAKQLYDESGVLGREQYEEICEQFGVHQIESNGYIMYNYHRHKEDFLNLKKIREIYGEE